MFGFGFQASQISEIFKKISDLVNQPSMWINPFDPTKFTVDASGRVSSLLTSLGGVTLTQATQSRQPIYSTSAIGGTTATPGLVLANQGLQGNFSHNGSAFTLTMLVSMSSASEQHGRPVSFVNSGNNDYDNANSFAISRDSTTSNLRVERTSTSFVIGSGYDTLFLITVVFDGTTLTIWRNGQKISTTNSGGTFNFNRMVIGSDRQNLYWFSGRIGTMISWPLALNDVAREEAEAILAWNHFTTGLLPDTNLGKAKRPSNLTRAWTPADLPAGTLKAWWDVKDVSTTTLVGGFRSNTVSSWASKVGNINATQATSSKQPSYITTGAVPYLQFDGIDDSLLIDDVSSFPSGAAPSTLVTIAGNANATNDGYRKAFSYGNAADKSWRALERMTGTGNANASYYGADAQSAQTWTSAGSVVVGVTNGTVQGTQVTVDGKTSTMSYSSSGNINTQLANGFIGSNVLNEYWNGPIYGQMVISGAVSDANRMRLEGWGAWQYGLQANLAATHPFKSAPPTI